MAVASVTAIQDAEHFRQLMEESANKLLGRCEGIDHQL